ncbi:EamA family transporter [Cellulomonas dongxiuzhuiae]|uniref:DMT family transporter n=1 Tax=Cellulomonas dongxiuzhuiae TaxID=2819979 RepID=A0ABX8GN25_9CELL|nr:DMT family transporter [Cellulomonas dongxiuzhuiae]MBO3096018.1 EamA family transporter [Cellulomonas dongxiuzhuiae]QWC17300.1 DMT family transporter [Cellulomonas dongxiuzhuiae]
MQGSGARSAGIVAGLVAALAFATSGPVVKPLLAAGWSPGAAIVVRLTIGALLLAGPAAWALRGRWSTLRTDWATVVGLGILGVAGASTLYFFAVDRLPVAVALLVEYTGPLLLLVWGWARTGRVPARATLVGAALAMGGLVLVLDVTGSLQLDPLGLVFACGAAIGNAGYFALTARPIALPPVSLAGAAMLVGAVVVGSLAAVGVLPVEAPDVRVDVLGAQVHWAVPLLVVGAVPTAFAYGVSAVSVRLLGERLASFLALSEVLLSVLLAWVLLGEQPLVVQGLGAVLVVAGVALVRAGADRDVRRGAAPPPAVDVTPERAAQPAAEPVRGPGRLTRRA